MIVVRFLIFIWWCIGAIFCHAQETPKRYVSAYKNDANIKVDGKLEKREWKHVQKESGFTFPWLTRRPPLTQFFAIIDSQYFNFAFQVEDKDIVVKNFAKEIDVAQGDRVEIFFAKSLDLKEYYCLEISPEAKVLDYKASFYRNFDDTWNCEGLLVAAKRKNDGYVVEGRIPIKTLLSLGIADRMERGSCLLMGVYRGEYSTGDAEKPHVEWISWIRPDTVEPDFHVPSSFGLFCIAPE